MPMLEASGDEPAALARRACLRLLGQTAERVVAVAGSRSTALFRVVLRDRSVIVARRRDRRQAHREADILRALRLYGATVPAVHAFDGEWLIQEDLGERRLSQQMDEQTGETLEAGIEALAEIHSASHKARLAQRVDVVRRRSELMRRLIQTPQRIGQKVGLPAPEVPFDSVACLLSVEEPQFIHGDARPGNAIVRDDGGVAWFDFEQGGLSLPLDDLAFLLGDEYTPEQPDFEQDLLARYLPSFVRGVHPASATTYLRTFGTLHICARLALILEKKADGPWWDQAYCLREDRACVTLNAALRLCRRGKRWASDVQPIAPLARWLDSVQSYLEGGSTC